MSHKWVIFCWKNPQHGRQSIHLNPLPADILPYLTCIFANQALLEPYGRANHVMILKVVINIIFIILDRLWKNTFSKFFLWSKSSLWLENIKKRLHFCSFLKRENRKIFLSVSLPLFYHHDDTIMPKTLSGHQFPGNYQIHHGQLDTFIDIWAIKR